MKKNQKKPASKPTPKSKPAPATAPKPAPAAVPVAKVVPTSSLKLVERPQPDRPYAPLFERIGKLQPGQSIVLDVPKDSTLEKLFNNVNAAIHRYRPQFPTGCRIVKRSTVDGRMAILCEKKSSK